MLRVRLPKKNREVTFNQTRESYLQLGADGFHGLYHRSMLISACSQHVKGEVGKLHLYSCSPQGSVCADFEQTNGSLAVLLTQRTRLVLTIIICRRIVRKFLLHWRGVVQVCVPLVSDPLQTAGYILRLVSGSQWICHIPSGLKRDIASSRAVLHGIVFLI